MTGLAVRLQEWSSHQPKPGSPLIGLSLSPGARQVAGELTSSGRLEILEFAQGLEIRTTSWVGRIVLDDLTITVEPKIKGMPLLSLFRYAYNLRDLKIFDITGYGYAPGTFQDLILHQLAAEAEEIIYRGLHREYEATRDDLASPRGRLDFHGYVRQAGTVAATLPCIHHPRTRATLLNQVLKTGLSLGASVGEEIELKVRLRDLARTLEMDVPTILLDQEVIGRAMARIDRRTEVFRPAMTLIELLVQALGISFDNPEESFRSPGFLFDMNRFFQALLSRFLAEYLIGYVIEDEYRLKGIMAYHPSHNPQSRSSPTPRPDFAVMRGGQIASVLDAKYRDLWKRGLPTYMLYQLAIYALMQPESRRRSTILYPTLSLDAIDEVIQLRDPVHGKEAAQVVLRPVNLLELEQLLSGDNNHQVFRSRAELAHRLVFGSGSK